MASTAGEIFDEHGGDALAIAELLVREQARIEGKNKALVEDVRILAKLRGQIEPLRDENHDLRAERDRLRAQAESAKAVVRAWRANEVAPFSSTKRALFAALDALARAYEDGGVGDE